MVEKTSPRSLVYQTLLFDRPNKVPRQLWLLPWANLNYPEDVRKIQERFPDDIISAPGFRTSILRIQGDPYEPGVYIDEWGCRFENKQRGVIGEVKQPLIRSWEDLEKLRLPEELLSIDREQINSFCRDSDLFILGGCCPRPFERMQFLRGSFNLFLDIAEESSDFFYLLDKVHDFYLRELELWASTQVDALMFMDDWGSQHSLLISPRQWRKIFKPLYQEYIDLAHQYGKFIFMHSDGYIEEIIPDLVDMGLDALNSQLFVMNIEALGEKFAGKLTFWGEIDRQYVLPFAEISVVKEAVRRVKNAFWRNGGCIAQCEFSAGAKPENVWAVFETWEKISLYGDRNGLRN